MTREEQEVQKKLDQLYVEYLEIHNDGSRFDRVQEILSAIGEYYVEQRKLRGDFLRLDDWARVQRQKRQQEERERR